MHIEALKVFCDLVETQSFSLAAERNFVTSSAVSQQIQRLEDKFTRRLLDRVGGRRKLRLTPAGRFFYQECKNVLLSYDTLQEGMSGSVSKISGTVRVAAVYSVGLHELPPKVREFMSKFPAAKIDLEYSRTTRVVRDVLDSTVELGIVAYPEPRRGLMIVPMASDRLVLICAPEHEFAEREEIKVTELKGHDFVSFERDIPTRRATDKILKSYGVDIRKIAEFDNIETIKHSVEVGFGLAIVPRPSVMSEKRNKLLAVIELAEKDWIRPVGVIHRSKRTLSVAAKKFVQLLAANSQKT